MPLTIGLLGLRCVQLLAHAAWLISDCVSVGFSRAWRPTVLERETHARERGVDLSQVLGECRIVVVFQQPAEHIASGMYRDVGCAGASKRIRNLSDNDGDQPVVRLLDVRFREHRTQCLTPLFALATSRSRSRPGTPRSGACLSERRPGLRPPAIRYTTERSDAWRGGASA